MPNSGISEPTLHEQLTDSNQSALKRYQSLVLGSSSRWYLVKYELVMLLTSWVPGALGLLLRKIFYPTILGSVGKNVNFGQGVTIRHGNKITIGDNVVVDDSVTMDAKGSSNTGITVKENTILSRNAVLSCKNGDLEVGRECTIGISVLVHATEGSGVKIGNQVLIGAFTYIIGSGPYRTERLDVSFKKQGIAPQGGINIEDNVWLGSNVQIQDGVRIASGSIVGSSAVVNRNVQEFEVVAGVPIKP